MIEFMRQRKDLTGFCEMWGGGIRETYERASLDQFPAKPVRLVTPDHGVVAQLAGLLLEFRFCLIVKRQHVLHLDLSPIIERFVLPFWGEIMPYANA